MSKHKRQKKEGVQADLTHESLAFLTFISGLAQANRMTRFALKRGGLSAYHCYARGTVPGHILSLLGLSGVRRKLVTVSVPHARAEALMEALCREFKIGREGKGIAFLQSLSRPENSTFSLLVAVVNEGEGEDVVESARQSQPVGATILKALGTADHSQKSFDFEIIPHKELVLIIARNCHVPALCRTIYDAMRTDRPGRGILFSMALERVEGILDMAPDCQEDRDPVSLFRPQEVQDPDLVALVAIADRGHTGDIVAALERSGGTGATTLHFGRTDAGARGWSSPLTDEEKEVVIILTPRPVARAIKEDLIKNFHQEEGRSIILGKLAVDAFQKLSEPEKK